MNNKIQLLYSSCFVFSVMCTQFISKTHLIFTGGKDGKIKQWDADNFEHIVTLQVPHDNSSNISVLYDYIMFQFNILIY